MLWQVHFGIRDSTQQTWMTPWNLKIFMSPVKITSMRFSLKHVGLLHSNNNNIMFWSKTLLVARKCMYSGYIVLPPTNEVPIILHKNS